MPMDCIRKEMKDRLGALRIIIGKYQKTINALALDLNKHKDIYIYMKHIYKKIDRHLAEVDGRYKVIPTGVSGIKKEKPFKKILASMTEEQKRKLIVELMSEEDKE